MGDTESSLRATADDIDRLITSLLYALKLHDAAACAALFTANGQILSPYGPLAEGTAEIAATHQAWFDEGETNKRLTLLEAGTSGDLGYCLLAWAGDYPQPDGSCKSYRGRSLNVLRRSADGSWRIHLSSLNADQA